MLSYSQFLVLTAIEKSKARLTQREIASICNLSLGAVNKALGFFNDNAIVLDMELTQKGRETLEPYRVKRAIFIAAGFGSRLVPITLNTPKPLVMVKGKRMIETLLDAVVEAGIEEIIIVRGYLGEQFDILLKKYPNITFVDNKDYNIANNISSAYLVKDLIKNSYMMEADLVLSNKNLITKYQFTSNYLGVPVAKTDDWCFKVSNNRINKLAVGGRDCFHMFGISYWSEADGEKLCDHIAEVYNNTPGGKERYWDQVALDYYINQYDIEVRPCSFEDIVEIDTFNDLKAMDKIYDC